MTDLDGKRVDLSSYKGRPIFLNMWATWCPPCLSEMPSIARLASDPPPQGRGLPLHLRRGTPPPVRGFASPPLPCPMTMLLSVGPPSPLPSPTPGLPTTYLIAPDGRIARTESGEMVWDSPT